MGSLIIKIVSNGSFDNSRLKFLQDEIRKVLGLHMSVDIQFTEKIPLTMTGKFRVTISNIRV